MNLVEPVAGQGVIPCEARHLLGEFDRHLHERHVFAELLQHTWPGKSNGPKTGLTSKLALGARLSAPAGLHARPRPPSVPEGMKSPKKAFKDL